MCEYNADQEPEHMKLLGSPIPQHFKESKIHPFKDNAEKVEFAV